MAEEKSALQSAREWVVEHKLRAVGTFLPKSSLTHHLLASPSAPAVPDNSFSCSCFKGRCGSVASWDPSPTTGPGRG